MSHLLEDKTVLVTGASGFTGRYMIDALKQRGCHIVGLGGTDSCADATIPCDLTDAGAVRQVVAQTRPDYVVHLAALSFVGHGDAEGFYRVNVFGTLNLLDALAQLEIPPRKVLLASSANVYGTPEVEVIDESICPAPVNHYACSKLAMEHMARTWFARLPIIITRPFNYTGFGQDERFLIPKIVGHFKRGARFIELGNLDVSRDFSDVADVVNAYVALLESDAASVTVNVCSGRASSLREVIAMMNTMAGYAIEVRVNPAFVRQNEIPRMVGDNTLLRHLAGIVPQTPLASTLQRMYADAR